MMCLALETGLQGLELQNLLVYNSSVVFLTSGTVPRIVWDIEQWWL
jgi:hypothetical protein